LTALHEAVDALTTWRIEHIAQAHNGITCTEPVTIEHEPLLMQLEAAVTSAIGRGGGGGNPEGNVLNTEALHRASVIRSAIKDWCRLVHVQATGNMVDDLERWFVIFKMQADPPEFYEHQVVAWVEQIGDLLDPPVRIEITGPCPVCRSTTYKDADDVEHPFPVVVEYRRERPLEATALCRAEGCERGSWVGERALRELRWELDAQATA
jgi:hypothetical protein